MAEKEMHMVEVSNDHTTQKMNKMGSTILDSFTKLTSENEVVRLDGGITLLRHLSQQNSDQIDSKELKYAITRIIRSLGSSKMYFKKGCYTTLTVFLTMHPETQIDTVLSVMDKELHPVGSNNKGENADIYMGRILTYGALIRSKILYRSSIEVQLQVVQDILKAGNQRSHLSFLSTVFLLEFIQQLDIECIRTSFWPIIETEFGKQWSELTLDSFYVLLLLKNKFPLLINRQFLKKHLKNEDIVTKETMENSLKILTDLPRLVSCQHPVFKLFCDELKTSELIVSFWTGIDRRFAKPSKTDEHLAVEVLRLLLKNITDTSILPMLLSPNFLQHVLKKLTNCKRNRNDKILIAFKELLTLLVSTTSSKDVKQKTQISVLKKLLLYPGDLMIEKKTGIKVIQAITGKLSLDGVKKVSKLYRDIIENVVPVEKQNANVESHWTNAERTYAAQLLTKLMGHPETIADQEWRLEQLQFLFRYGLCEVSNVGVELAPHFKDSFYRALDHKLSKLSDLRNVLSALVDHLKSCLSSNEITLRSPLTDVSENAWKSVISLKEKLENNTKKAEATPIFHTMILHMGLQLFSDSEVAIMSINELQSCYERLVKKSKKNKQGNGKKEEEPEWVEVVVDLLLSLLSRNSHLLRSLVGCVFPHICPYLTTAAVYQILAVLDVKNGKNPLVEKTGQDIDEDSSDMEETSTSDFDDQSEDDNNIGETESSDENGSDSNEDSANEDETVTDRLRLAVRQALGDASVQTDDDDVDVDQIGEEEGKRLDESLAAAFRILRENRQSRSKKQEKTAQTLTHFRVRVTDLLEAYLESGPSMVIALDMLVPLFALLEYCIKNPHEKPLEIRVRSCLKKLSTVKKFKDMDGVNNDLLITVLKALIEKGERSASVCQEMSDKLAECCTFLVRCSQQVNTSTQDIIKIYGENLTAFFKKRDCVLPAVLFKSILQLYWEGNWQLAPLLVDYAFDSTIRSFRRGQALEFLTVFYKNHRLIHSDTDHSKSRLVMEKKLCQNSMSIFREICNVNNKDKDQSDVNHTVGVGKDVKQKFVCLLLTLLHTVYTQHMPKAWDWKSLATVLTSYRSHVSLAKDAKSAYNKLAVQIGASVNVPAKENKSDITSKINGLSITKNEGEDMAVIRNGDTDTEAESAKDSESAVKRKKKNKQKDKHLLKKEARELRAKAMSEGFEVFEFSSVDLPESMEECNALSNGESHDAESSLHIIQKRTLSQSTDTASKPKRKKKTRGD
ncbi:hypothetical protein KM043_012535 [Ampulex compressa]|nr:hypothetical protein KM043_012535 [Ampulex compressa]